MKIFLDDFRSSKTSSNLKSVVFNVKAIASPNIHFHHKAVVLPNSSFLSLMKSSNCSSRHLAFSPSLLNWVPSRNCRVLTAGGQSLFPTSWQKQQRAAIQFSGGSQFATLIDHTSFFLELLYSALIPSYSLVQKSVTPFCKSSGGKRFRVLRTSPYKAT